MNDLTAAMNAAKKRLMDQRLVKIIQLLPMPNDAQYQGCVFGLGSDGVVYEASNSGWIAVIPLEFKQGSLK